MAEKLASLRKKGGGGAKLYHDNTDRQLNTSSYVYITCGFKPTYVFVQATHSVYQKIYMVYDNGVTTLYLNGNATIADITSLNLISITSNGFGVKGADNGWQGESYVIAVKE